MIKGSKVSVLAAVLLGTSLAALAVSDKQRAEIDERTKPVGSVCIEGDSNCGAVVASTGAAGGAKSGADIYNTNCVACHSTGAAGAPKLGDATAWAVRVDKGIDQVYANAIGGFNAMPAKGMCMSCSDDDIKATVDYMVENSK